ncbi:hypothetical protein SSABA_v1c04650 [Spiroplasma sabaudiense Ar-1343]|uniref:Transmembrane protein n=1 Tax=Spiroplasma sabaudiense Ar-1343 TaxID=1276257 RepID=W6A9Z7_9MOLU|nr:hypothetical protein [Spiroplasma sabaudiense]AHI53872.1 hypothetical protein SSABA_v1c04650 [Spiroplasma sabaudiense Ar-1343]
MDIKWISLLVISILYFAALLISGILALRYQAKHKTFKKISHELENNILQFKKSFEENFQENNFIKSNYDLPKNEGLYLEINNFSCYKTTVPKSKKEIFTDENESEFKVTYLKENYTLKNNKFKVPDFFGKLYLTNLRILFQNSEGFFQLPLSQINGCIITVLNINGFYKPGVIIKTATNYYRVVTDSTEIGFYINKLLN